MKMPLMLRISTLNSVKQILLCSFAFAFLLIACPDNGRAQVTLTTSGTVPTPGPLDVSNLTTPVVPLGSQYNNTAYSNNNGHAGTGQSFTVGSTPVTLNAICIMGGGSCVLSPSPQWNIAIFKVGAGNALTLLTSVINAVASPAPGSTDWLTFTFTGANAINLAPNTQ